MSRSIGHRPYKRTDAHEYYETTERCHRPWHRHQGAWGWHTLYDFRLTREEIRLAAKEKRRPRKVKIRRDTVAYTYGRGHARSITAIQVAAAEFEGGARGRMRAETVKAVKVANTRKKKAEFDRALDITSYRTRGQAVWDAT